MALKSFDIELSTKCIKCGHRSSIAIDPNCPLVCDRCGAAVAVEDWCLLEGD